MIQKILGLVHYVNQALRANHLFEKGKDYIVQNDKLKIIDELNWKNFRRKKVW